MHSQTIPHDASTIAIVLAAGASRRLGQPKQLLPWQGRPLLVHCIETLAAADCEQIVVVLGAHAEQCQQACANWFTHKPLPGCDIHYGYCAEWSAGQAASLNFGLQLARTTLESPFDVLIALCDQPLLNASDYSQLISALRIEQTMISAARYAEGPGAPACFHHRSQWQLSQTSGDRGARAWIRQQPATEVKQFDFSHRTQDIDTLEQWLQINDHS